MTDRQKLAEAVAYLMRYDGTFKFLVDMKKLAANPTTQFTVRQVEAILKCKAREKDGRGEGQRPEWMGLEVGVYSLEREGRAEPDIVKVKLTRDKQRKYSVVLTKIGGTRIDGNEQKVHWDWVYSPGLIKMLKPEMRMDEEGAKQFGILYGICANCGRTLKDAKSVEAGIGPVCIKHFRF